MSVISAATKRARKRWLFASTTILYRSQEKRRRRVLQAFRPRAHAEVLGS
jgi:hypothetical protein